MRISASARVPFPDTLEHARPVYRSPPTLWSASRVVLTHEMYSAGSSGSWLSVAMAVWIRAKSSSPVSSSVASVFESEPIPIGAPQAALTATRRSANLSAVIGYLYWCGVANFLKMVRKPKKAGGVVGGAHAGPSKTHQRAGHTCDPPTCYCGDTLSTDTTYKSTLQTKRTGGRDNPSSDSALLAETDGNVQLSRVFTCPNYLTSLRLT